MSWHLRDRSALFQSKHASIDVRLSNGAPSLNIHRTDVHSPSNSLKVSIAARENQTLQSESSLELGEAYVRQNDLIANYPEKAPCRFGFQMDLRWIEPQDPDLVCLEIWLSVQTSLLDSHPRLDFGLSGERFESLTPELWIGVSKRFCLAIHPLDQADCVFAKSTDDLRMSLFGRFMEKGVIRRLRLRIMACSHACDNSYWTDRMQEFSGSPLPLTT